MSMPEGFGDEVGGIAVGDEAEVLARLRTRISTFWPAAQWPGNPHKKNRWPGVMMRMESLPEL